MNEPKKTSSEAESAELSAGLRRFLYFTATITGAVILIVEILGAKMLSPFLGTSHFVWTAQIAVTLVALSAGYFVGGWVVGLGLDKKQRRIWQNANSAELCAATCQILPNFALKIALRK